MKRLRCSALTTVALVGALLVPAGAQGASVGVIPDGGIRVGMGPSGDPCQQVRNARDAGFPWVSVGGIWADLEPTQGQYLEPNYQRQLLQCAKDMGLKTQLVMTDAPAWASGRNDTNDPPTTADIPAYAAFLGNLAGQLGPLVDVWTVWNEPNFQMFWAAPRDPAHYVALQKAGYQAIKQVDPTSVVSAAPVVGTPTGNGTNAWDYMNAAWNAGLAGSADLYLVNFYPRTAPEGTATDSAGRPAPWTLSGQTYMRQLVEQHDPGKPIWITETSYSTCQSCTSGAANQASEATQADYIGRMYTYRRRYLQGVVDRIFWYETQDGGPDIHDWFQNLGIFRWDGSAKPAVATLDTLRVTGTTPDSPASGGSGGGNGGGASGVPVPTLPTGASSPPAPAAGATRAGLRVSLGRLHISARLGRITVTVKATVSTGAARLRVEGYRARKWRAVQTVRLRGSATVHVRFTDRGDLGVRVLLRPESSRKWLASRVGRVPTFRR